MEKESKEFLAWLKRNSNHLRDYAPNEIAHLALCCGFSLEIICGPTADHFLHLKRLLRFWDSPFAKNWISLMFYEHGKGD